MCYITFVPFILLWQKICFHCGSNQVIKRGVIKGSQRWYCKSCHHYFSGSRRVIASAVNNRYSQGNLTVLDLAEEFGVSVRTIYRRLTKTYIEELPKIASRPVVVLMDATYWGYKFGIVIMKDVLQGDVLWHKFIHKKETLLDYREGIEFLEKNNFVILGIVSDGLKGLREQFPQYKFQLCQFHQVMTIKTKLTLHPKLPASSELLSIAMILCHTDKESFIGALEQWHERWEGFINERAVGADGKSHYMHKRTRSAYFSLRRNMPWLWTWYDHPELHIPNTNNGIEALNSDLKAKLNLHKGITKERRKVFIQDYIKSHKPRK